MAKPKGRIVSLLLSATMVACTGASNCEKLQNDLRRAIDNSHECGMRLELEKSHANRLESEVSKASERVREFVTLARDLNRDREAIVRRADFAISLIEARSRLCSASTRTLPKSGALAVASAMKLQEAGEHELASGAYRSIGEAKYHDMETRVVALLRFGRLAQTMRSHHGVQYVLDALRAEDLQAHVLTYEDLAEEVAALDEWLPDDWREQLGRLEIEVEQARIQLAGIRSDFSLCMAAYRECCSAIERMADAHEAQRDKVGAARVRQADSRSRVLVLTRELEFYWSSCSSESELPLVELARAAWEELSKSRGRISAN